MSTRPCLDVGAGKLVAKEEDQAHLNYLDDSVSTGKLVAVGFPGNSGDSGTPYFNKLRAAHVEGLLDR